MISFKAILSVVFLAAFPAQVVSVEQRSMRILLNNGDDSNSSKMCSAADIDVIKTALWTEQNHHRQLQFGPNDDPCYCKCEGWVPGYCYWYFCPWVNGTYRRKLTDGNGDLVDEQPLSSCAEQLVEVNNVLNQAMPLVSEDCQELLRSDRAFSCQ